MAPLSRSQIYVPFMFYVPLNRTSLNLLNTGLNSSHKPLYNHFINDPG